MIVRTTEDGSKTVYSEQFKQYYHSVFGAKTESQWVYIELGYLDAIKKFDAIRILEVGFGTGLNAFLSQKMAEKHQISTSYIGLEAFPIQPNLFQNLNEELQVYHTSEWERPLPLSKYFKFEKKEIQLESYESDQLFHLIYFDAFAPDVQPELWTADIFKKLKKLLVQGGIMTTYCSKVMVQKNLKQAGYKIEKHQGPPHKREILRAINLH
jgi:tRNA U34 5-methylaminomethyl-2-thiouridine-forming methyltransferase MnmC